MPFKKLDQYNDLEIKVSELCFALAHPARIRIIHCLNKYTSLSLDELSYSVELSKSSCSRHIQVLKDANLVRQLFLPNLHVFELNQKMNHAIREILYQAEYSQSA